MYTGRRRGELSEQEYKQKALDQADALAAWTRLREVAKGKPRGQGDIVWVMEHINIDVRQMDPGDEPPDLASVEWLWQVKSNRQARTEFLREYNRFRTKQVETNNVRDRIKVHDRDDAQVLRDYLAELSRSGQ